MNNKKVYIVECYRTSCDVEEEIIEPIIAFLDLEKAKVFIGQCEIETENVKSQIKKYWKANIGRYGELTSILRDRLKNKEINKIINSKEQLEMQDIDRGCAKIENSHKYHPEYPIFESEEIEYDITTLDLVE